MLSLCLCSVLKISAQPLERDFFPTELSRPLVMNKTAGNPRSFSIITQIHQMEEDEIPVEGVVEEYSLVENTVRQINYRIKKDIIRQYHFDSLSRILSIRDFSNDTDTPWQYYYYDDQLNTATELVLRKDSTVYSKTVLKFDEDNRLIESQDFWGETNLKTTRRYQYNNRGDIEVALSQGSEEEIFVYAYQYDSVGMPHEYTRFKNEQLESRVTFEYYPDSLVEVKTLYGFNEKPKSQLLTVEKDSMRVEVTGYFSSLDSSTYRSRFKQVFVGEDLVEYESRTIRGTYVDRYKTFYDYDSHGNWTKKTTYLNNDLMKVEIRLFRY